MAARTIRRSNGGRPARATVSVAGCPFGPRTLAIAWSSVRPSTADPSIAVIASSALRPAAWAGDAAIVDATVIRQAGPSGAHVPPAAADDRAVTTAPIPSNWPARESRALWR